jgi:N-acetylglucosaminyldiphosphoundecaprenol N-acetyl-beta-D-mannosaminyltransferase
MSQATGLGSEASLVGPIDTRVSEHNRAWLRTATPVRILGVGFDGMTQSEVVEHVLGSIASGRGGWIVTANTDVLRQVVRDPTLHTLISSADLVVADGMPIVWASRLQRTPVPERVAGSTLIATLSRAAAPRSVPVFLLGGAEDVARRAAVQLALNFPGLLTGHHFPPFGFESNAVALEEIESVVASFGPAVYFCGFGFPKQERLMVELARRHPDSWFIASGAGLAFIAGAARRAPHWMQRAGLEWLHRLGQEPRRLCTRYLARDLPFAVSMTVRCALAGVRPTSSR